MPREYVYDSMSPRNIREGERAFAVMVGWQRDHEHVTVATVNPNANEEEMFSAAAGLHVHLSRRSEVNDLIRYLRRARDQAFGRDE